jgi:hypothetical protein
MKNTISTLLTIFLFISCENQNPSASKNDLESMKLKGNVVSLVESIYTVVINGDLIDSTKCSDEIFTFNEKGYIAEKTLLYPDGSINQKEIYYYNKNHQIREKEKFDSKNEKIGIIKYKYYLNSDSIEVEFIDLKENVKTVVKYKENFDTTTYEYPTTFETEFFSIDGNNDTISFMKNITIYNSHGDIITEKQIDETKLDKNKKTINYKYIYDEYQNWTKKMKYIDSIPTIIINRELTYK